MIERYTRAPMAELWSLQHKFETWLEVELLAAEAWEQLGKVPAGAPARMRKNATFTVERIDELELTTHHDVVAFTRCVSESLGDDSRWLHYGLTSTDVVDTALSRNMVAACDMLEKDLEALLAALRDKALAYKDTPCMGRTHGIHAEPTVFGLKFALWYADTQRNLERLRQARAAIAVGKLSGAVGNYGNIDPFVEKYVCEHMGLTPSPISTQVLQRDRHAQLLSMLAIIGGCVEKTAQEIRHLQRTELREAEEPFRKGQTGSSTMPHKRNPVKCEQLCGLSRLLRGYALSSFENIALWHERDISHSSAERVILSDATTLLDYMLSSLTNIIQNMHIYPQNMQKTMAMSHGLVYSQRTLLALVARGMDRTEAYGIVQGYAMEAWEKGCDYIDLLRADERITSLMTEEELAGCFRPEKSFTHIGEIYERLGLTE